MTRLKNLYFSYIIYYYGSMCHYRGRVYLPEDSKIGNLELENALTAALEKQFPISYIQASTGTVFRYLDMERPNDNTLVLGSDNIEPLTAVFSCVDAFNCYDGPDSSFVCSRVATPSERFTISISIEEEDK